MSTFPLIFEIAYSDPAQVFRLFSTQAWAFFLDSADFPWQRDDTNRYSYIVFDPFEKIVLKNQMTLEHSESVCNPFLYLKNKMSKFIQDRKPGYPPFQGGVLGYFSYDLCHYLERINFPKYKEDLAYADLAVGLYDIVVAFDHRLEKGWIISSGFPELSEARRLERAQQRLTECFNKITTHSATLSHPVFKPVSLKSPFTKNEYIELVKQAQHYIREGDIFEVNLSQRFQGKTSIVNGNYYGLYLAMRKLNPSPFSAYLNLGDYQILSSSPERFLLHQDGVVSTRPIKGTARRGKSIEEDNAIAKRLLSCEKNCSENIMIVDLLRNDLSKVCEIESVVVKKLCGLESYPTVHHLVSVVEGKLKPHVKALDLLEACFPGGSITGAPKIRAMQIIYELEPTARGPYCGSIGFIGFDDTMDTSIVIRTLLAHGDTVSYQVGGAVILDSSPEEEYEETLTKSAAIRQVLG